MPVLGATIEARRGARGWDQAVLARKAGLSQSTVSRMEAADVGSFASRSVEKIAKALAVSVTDLAPPPREETIESTSPATAPIDLMEQVAQLAATEAANRVGDRVIRELRRDAVASERRGSYSIERVRLIEPVDARFAASGRGTGGDPSEEVRERVLYRVRVYGDCMAPTIKDGQTVDVDPAAEWSDGAVVVARHGDDLLCKRVVYRDGVVYLLADDGTVVPADEQTGVLGVVVDRVEGL